MTKLIAFILALSLYSCCKKDDSHPLNETELPKSQFFLTADNDTLYDISYSACDRTPSASESLDNISSSSNILFSPGIYHANDMVNIPDDLVFYFVFHDVDTQFSGDPFLDEFWSYLQTDTSGFNKTPYKRDFFLRVRKEGKVYQNWWNGNLLNLPLDISRDETGLEFKDYEFSKFDEFGDICLHDYSVIRLQGGIEGELVTEDYNDTISVSGRLDVFLNFRE